jgi:hypothetical protein
MGFPARKSPSTILLIGLELSKNTINNLSNVIPSLQITVAHSSNRSRCCAALVAISGPKKVAISGPTPSNGPRYEFPPSKSIRPAPYKQQVH